MLGVQIIELLVETSIRTFVNIDSRACKKVFSSALMDSIQITQRLKHFIRLLRRQCGRGNNALNFQNILSIVLNLNHMGYSVISSHKAVAGFKGTSCLVVAYWFLYRAIKPLAISSHRFWLAEVTLHLKHHRFAQMLYYGTSHKLLPC